MDISATRAKDALIVSASGELDLHTSREFRLRVDAEIERHGLKDLVLDFTSVGFVDSSGLGALLGRYKKVREKGGRLALAGCAPHVDRLLELSGVPRIIRTFPSVEKALGHLGAEAAPGSGRRMSGC